MYNTKDERNKKIIEMRLRGMTFTAIGEKMGISKQAVNEIVKRNCGRLSYGIRGYGFKIDEIVYQGIYDYFIKNEHETLTSFSDKILSTGSIEKIKYFIIGKRNCNFTLKTIKKICEVIGEPFEVVFALRKNMED